MFHEPGCQYSLLALPAGNASAARSQGPFPLLGPTLPGGAVLAPSEPVLPH